MARPATVPGSQPIEIRRREIRILVPRLTEEERAAHLTFVATLGPNALWNSYLGSAAS
jgi:hypothetical protein